ncbi:acyl-CoA dehydrogenase family protein [Streptomyces sp. NPDC057011]|uniref:acyl-CoA dehydrogenase family protein n=1 Tax=unclassified Streptomyces TaxID=2593676 RepID=UPI0036250DDE
MTATTPAVPALTPEPAADPGRPWDPYRLSARLERALGDPRDPAGPLSAARGAALDRAEAFPADACRHLDALGLPRWFVPAEHGGALTAADELLQIIRILGRRDFTVALAHTKTYLGAVSVWVAGTPEQAAALGARVAAGDVVSLAVTEQAHGSDLLAGELTAEPTPDGGYRLTGEKWLINNATRAHALTVLARTAEAGGSRGFTTLLVDKAALADGTWHPLPPVPTQGVRGADISGIAFRGATVPAGARVGAEGEGLEVVLKGFQITRTLCSAMSLGMTDHALRLALDFATGHRLYGRPLAGVPHAARTLAEAYADLLAAEAAALVATRGIHTLTGEQSVVSAAVKYFVPTSADRTIGDLRGLLGARAMLVDAHADGAFQKLERDHRIVGIFDGSTVVNLNSLINQFPVLARAYRKGLTDTGGLTASARLDAPVPALDPARLALYSRAGSSVVQALPAAAAELAGLADAGLLPPGVGALGARLHALADALHEEMAAQRPSARDVPVTAFDLAGRYAVLYAAAASLHLYLRNRDLPFASGPLWTDAAWLEAVLTRLLRKLDPAPDLDDADGPALDRLLPALHAQHTEHLLFSLLPCPLAEGSAPETEETP